MSETKFFAIFRAGHHVDMRGFDASYSAADVDMMAAVFDEQRMPAPIVIGHPVDNQPAYGLVRKLIARSGTLFALADILPAFAELVRAGRYKNRSASFYRPDAVANPVPGAWYLRHVGFLGAAAPAVKGLGDANFTSQEHNTVCFDACCGDEFSASMPPRAGGARIDPDRLWLHRLAIDMQLACPSLNYIEAVSIAEDACCAVTCNPTPRG